MLTPFSSVRPSLGLHIICFLSCQFYGILIVLLLSLNGILWWCVEKHRNIAISNVLNDDDGNFYLYNSFLSQQTPNFVDFLDFIRFFVYKFQYPFHKSRKYKIPEKKNCAENNWKWSKKIESALYSFWQHSQNYRNCTNFCFFYLSVVLSLCFIFVMLNRFFAKI